jgi:hypothetical protein
MQFLIPERDASGIIHDMNICDKHPLKRASLDLRCSFCIKEQEFILQSQQKHHYKYDYSLINYLNSKTKIKIICNLHGMFEQLPYNHLSGQGCRSCANIENGLRRKSTTNDFIIKANKKHNNKYNYVEEYKGVDIFLKIECPEHGIFSQTPHSHLKGGGCLQCTNDLKSIKYRKTIEIFLSQCNQIHNYKYDYSRVNYINNKSKIKIICLNHGEFIQKAIHHLQGHGCPRCSAGANVSKLENEWLDSLQIPLQYRQAKLKINNKLIKADAFNPENKTIYEFYGDYFHGNLNIFNPNDMNYKLKKSMKELNQATIDREVLIKSAGYNLIFIWESEWKKMKKL